MADCKNTSDDALQNYLNSLKFRQSHWYTDVKLFLGYTAVVIAAAAFALDYKWGFEATKKSTTLAVIAYFILNGAFTYWIWYVEKNLIYIGAWKGRKVSLLYFEPVVGSHLLTKSDHHLLASRQVQPDISSIRLLPPLISQHHSSRRQRNCRSLHAMVHRRRLLRCCSLSTMARLKHRHDWRRRSQECHERWSRQRDNSDRPP